MITATFSRASAAYKSDGSQVASGVPRYEAGVSGRAIMVEEGTTNLYADGDYATGAATHPVRSGPWTVTTDPTGKWPGNVLRCDPHTGGAYHGRDIAVTIGTAYSCAVWCYVSPDFNLTDTAFPRLAGEQGFARTRSYDVTTKGTWQLLKIENHAASTTNARILAYARGGGAATWTVGYVLYKFLQFEQKPYCSSFASHLAPRAAESLYIPSSILPAPAGTVEVDAYIDAHVRRQEAGYNALFHAANNNGYVYVEHDNAPQWRFTWRAGGVTSPVQFISDALTPDGWHRFALAWSAAAVKLAVDGIVRASITGHQMPASWNHLYLGGIGNNCINSRFDGCRLYNRALTDEEIRASYEGRL